MNFGYIYAYFTYLGLLPFLGQRPLTIFLQVPLSCAVFPPLPFFCFPSLNISAGCFLACLSCVFLGVLSCGLRRSCPSHLQLLYFIFKRGLIFFCRKSVLLIFLRPSGLEDRSQTWVGECMDPVCSRNVHPPCFWTIQENCLHVVVKQSNCRNAPLTFPILAFMSAFLSASVYHCWSTLIPM